jgi:Zn-dependent oligopeptidase
LQSEFERDGIHLTDADRDEVRDWQRQIVQLEGSFQQNLLHSHNEFVLRNQNDAVTEIIPVNR